MLPASDSANARVGASRTQRVFGGQRLIGQQREQAGIGRLHRIERRAVARAAHHDDVGFEHLRQFAFFSERSEVVLRRDH